MRIGTPTCFVQKLRLSPETTGINFGILEYTGREQQCANMWLLGLVCYECGWWVFRGIACVSGHVDFTAALKIRMGEESQRTCETLSVAGLKVCEINILQQRVSSVEFVYEIGKHVYLLTRELEYVHQGDRERRVNY